MTVCFPIKTPCLKGGFGNLIALPLQKDQENVFAGVRRYRSASLSRPMGISSQHTASCQHTIEPTILRATGSAHPLDVTFIDEEDLVIPWKRKQPSTNKLTGQMPVSVNVTLAKLYFEKKGFHSHCQSFDPVGGFPES